MCWSWLESLKNKAVEKSTYLKDFCTSHGKLRITTKYEYCNDNHPLLVFNPRRKNHPLCTRMPDKLLKKWLSSGSWECWRISTLISFREKRERKWPLYKISMDPPLHDVNSRQHNAGVGSECQCRCFILPLPLFSSPPPRRLQLLPQSRGNFPLGDMDLVKDRPV